MGDGAQDAQRWFCGPPGRPRAYVVRTVETLRQGLTVVPAERLPDPADPNAYSGPVALKLDTDTSRVDVDEIAARLRRVAAIDHPNLGRPIESFLGPGLAVEPERAESADDVFYVAARWEDGVALTSIAPLAPDAAIRLARDVSGAVGALHDHGLAHRDLHPGNVIARPDGSSVVIDFGTVRPDDGGDTTTIAGVVGFIAPDVVAGGRGRDADRWGVGMLTVYALLGHPQGSTPPPVLRRELEGALAGAGDPRRAAAAILSMIDADPGRRPPDMERWIDAVERHVRPSRRRLAPMAAALLVAAAVAVGIVALTRDRTTDPDVAASDTTAATPVVVPRAGPPAAEPSVAPDACDAVEAEFLRAGAPAGSCWGGPEEAFVQGSTRSVTDADGAAVGIVVTAPDGRVTYLTPTMWQSYGEITGRHEPLDSPAYGGYPVAVERFTDPDAIAIRLDTGGLVLGPRDDTQMFWIPAQGVARWAGTGRLRGQLGFPASNLRVTFEGAFIEFEHGRLGVAAEDVALLQAGEEVPIVLDLPPDPTAGLPIARIRRAIIRQWGGQAWWIDAAGARHWIPDDATFTCLGGDGAVFPAADAVAGWTVWLFRLGAPATCASR